jgi:hypothetical protein
MFRRFKKEKIMPINQKRLVVELPASIWREIALRAIFKNQTRRAWIIVAVLEKINRERETE